MIEYRCTQWLIGLSTALCLSACSSSSSDKGGKPSSDAGMTTVDAGKTKDKDAASAPTPMLDANVAGKPCAKNDECSTGGSCVTEIDLAGAAGALTGGAGMPTPAPGGYCTLSCMSDAECGTGGACIGDFNVMGMAMPGLCQKVCTQSSDCRDGYRCTGAATFDFDAGGAFANFDAGALGGDGGVAFAPDPSACAPIPTTVTLAADIAGAKCTQDGDCKGGGTCQMQTASSFLPGTIYPDGYCTGPCIEDANCGKGGRCVLPIMGQGAGSCTDECKTDNDCRGGYRCRDQGNSIKGCIPGDPILADGEVGKACTALDGGASPDCSSRCLTDLAGPLAAVAGGSAQPAPGGYCSASCVDDSDCGGGLCLGGISFPGFAGVPGNCLKPCTKDEDCGRDGYVCTAYADPLAGFIGGAVDGGVAKTVCQPAG